MPTVRVMNDDADVEKEKRDQERARKKLLFLQTAGGVCRATTTFHRNEFG